MKSRIRCLLIIVIIFGVGCDNSDNQINLFLNPSLAFDFNKISVKVKVDEDIILDTVIENKHIDESLFIKKLSYKSTKNGLLHIEINDKKKDINLTHELSKCIDVFLRYDDHSLIFKEAKKIESERSDQHLPADFKQLFDSIKATSGNKYHQIIFNIKEGDCNNR
jgi:hypothetical protein